MFDLYDYQELAVTNTNDLLVRKGLRSGIIQIFTGGGKSIIAHEITRRYFPPEKNRVLFLAPSIHLVYQMHDNYLQYAPEWRQPTQVGVMKIPTTGIVMERLNDVNARIIVASVPTIVGNIMKPIDLEKLPEAEYQAMMQIPEGTRVHELARRQNQQFEYDKAPITRADVVITERKGQVSIIKSPTSLRRHLVSERMDQILANGGLPDLIIHDEAHHSPADGSMLVYQRMNQLAAVVEHPGIYLVGLTATPVREDQRALSNIYKTMIISRDFRYGQKHGHITPFAQQPIRILAKADEAGLRHVTANNIVDYTQFIIKTWKEKGQNRPTVFYAGKLGEMTAIEVSKMLAKAFNDAGIPAVHLDGDVCIGPLGVNEPKSHRRKYFQRVLDGRIQVICNVGVMVEGVDIPPISCVGLLTGANELRMTQIIGRALRNFKGNEHLPPKVNTLILDYTGDDIHVVASGSLMGFKVDPTSQMYVEVEDEEDELIGAEGLALEDAMRTDKVIISKGVAYSLSKIIAKSSGDWYHQEKTGSMSLGISKNDIMFISAPNMTKAMNVQYLQREMQAALATGECDNEVFPKLPPEKQKEYLDMLVWAENLYSNFVLWHCVQTGESGKYIVKNKNWLALNSALDMLEAVAVQYAHQAVDGYTEIFAEKGKTWKRQDMSEAQAKLIVSLDPTYDVEDLLSNTTKGEASKIISHLKASKAVQPFYDAVETMLKPFESFM